MIQGLGRIGSRGKKRRPALPVQPLWGGGCAMRLTSFLSFCVLSTLLASGRGFAGLSDGRRNGAEGRIVKVSNAQLAAFFPKSANRAAIMATPRDIGSAAQTKRRRHLPRHRISTPTTPSKDRIRRLTSAHTALDARAKIVGPSIIFGTSQVATQL
jgi:hypothetical protein